MFNKKIITITPDEQVNKYLRDLLSDLGKKLKTLLYNDNIIEEIDAFKPKCILLYYKLKNKNNKDIYNLIQHKSIYNSIPILLFSYDEEPENLSDFDNSLGFVKLPVLKEQLYINIERVAFKRKFVLIVDDSKLIHSMLRKILVSNNFGILEAYNGLEALGILKKQKPDIIISDIEMPEMNGYEFCKAVKQNSETENIPLIILSSLDSGIDIDRGFNAGANDYLTKPVDENEMISRINYLLSQLSYSTREKILVVDDSKTIRNMMIRGFEQQGFRTFFAVNGKEGLEKAKEIEPDLITTDYDMPVMNGWELCQELQKDKKLADIPVIMLTSRDSKSDRAKTSGLGVDEYLTKPFTVERLIVIVEKLIAQKRILRERELLKLYVSDAVMADTLRCIRDKDSMYQMRAKQIFATVLFTDIVSFTPICENLYPKKIIELLNDYFDLMCKILQEHESVIDKFIGDAILGIFTGVEDGAFRAVRAGLEMVNSLEKFNSGRDTPLQMRVGINSGKIFIGDIGSKHFRRDFTVIGDNVNVGQRLESNSKPNGVLISESTYELVKDYAEVEKVGPISLKGKKEKVYAYNVLAI